MEGYSNPKDALTTLLRVILGDFQYEELLEGDPVIGPTFFFFYIFFVFFILLNMFLAIINETYIAVKEELAQKRNDFEAMEYLKKGLVKIFRKLVSRWSRKDKEDKLASVQEKLLKRKALDEINRWQNDLQNRGYTDEEIEAVFGNYFVGAQVSSCWIHTSEIEKQHPNTDTLLVFRVSAPYSKYHLARFIGVLQIAPHARRVVVWFYACVRIAVRPADRPTRNAALSYKART